MGMGMLGPMAMGAATGGTDSGVTGGWQNMPGGDSGG